MIKLRNGKEFNCNDFVRRSIADHPEEVRWFVRFRAEGEPANKAFAMAFKGVVRAICGHELEYVVADIDTLCADFVKEYWMLYAEFRPGEVLLNGKVVWSAEIAAQMCEELIDFSRNRAVRLEAADMLAQMQERGLIDVR